MKSYSMLYQGKADLKAKLSPRILPSEVPYLVRIYTADALPEQAVCIAKEIQELLPLAQIVGSSACGVIHQGKEYNEDTLIIVEEYEKSEVYTADFIWKGKSAADMANEVANSIALKNVKFMHILCGDHYYDIHDFLTEFNKRCESTQLAGGVAGDILSQNVMGYVFTSEGVVEGGLVIGAVCGENLYTYQGFSIAHEPISPKYTLTSIKDGEWVSVDNIPAAKWVQDHLGVEELKVYEDWQVITDNDTLARFPMILEGQSRASRFLRYNEEVQGITQYFNTIPEGTQFRIGYFSPSECVHESFNICNELMDTPIETLFCYSCLFRRLYIHNCVEWELSPFRNLGLCGAFMMGEIGSINGKNELLNGSCGLVGVAENKVYVRPDIRVFEKIQSMEDESKDLLNFVLKLQTENINRYNDQLLEKLVEQQKMSEAMIYIDHLTGMNNYVKYKKDKKEHKFDKLCMARIENAELIISHLGHNAYTVVVKKAVDMLREYLKSLEEWDLLHCYVFNESTFFIAVGERMSEQRFREFVQQLFERFQLIQIPNSEEIIVSRIVAVLHQKELIEYALNAFQASKNLQMPLIIYEGGEEDQASTEEEFRMIGVLNRAVENDGIVPYFQGIYNNQKGCIDRYEALMRIVDVDGTVYSPAYFMNVAKKYHLYIALSKIMIQKVITLFAEKRDKVSINFSLYDIDSGEIQKLLFDLLENIEDASNIALEILEDEEFRDIEQLKKFIAKVRKYGVRILIDDFGSGYSNLLEIASIGPDFLKVDGSIIKDVHQKEVNGKILKVIEYLGRVLDAQIIAEFVENQDIQEEMRRENIGFSQGYYFARPLPYNMLELN